jgi:hypothetical protein
MESTGRECLAALLLAGGLALAACGETELAPRPGQAGGGAPAAKPVNVVLVVIDTLRADAVFDPAGTYDTPSLDRLAREGIAFERAFAAAPMTLPSHMSLFSSRPVLETGVLTNRQDVRTDLPLLAEWLAGHGYDTRAVLSLGTLGALDDVRSPGRGFHSYDCNYWSISLADKTFERLRESLAQRDARKPLFLFAHFADPHEPYDAHGTETHTVSVTRDGEPLVRLQAAYMQVWRQTVELGPGRTVFEFVTDEQATEFWVRNFDCFEKGQRATVVWEVGKEMQDVTQARAVIDRGERPSAECDLVLWVNDVPANRRLARKRYALDVAHADRYVGELLEELERLGLYEDSLVLFTSDHGEGLGEHGNFGHVQNLSDGLLRVPLILKLPAGDPRRAALEASAQRLVSHIDVVPTLLDVLGLPPLPGQRGASLFTPHETVHVAQTSKPEAKRNQLAFRDERYKMVYFPDEQRFELYDVREDPGELHDVFAERQGERAAWPARLRDAYERSQRIFASEGETDQAERDAMLRALGYGGDEE